MSKLKKPKLKTARLKAAKNPKQKNAGKGVQILKRVKIKSEEKPKRRRGGEPMNKIWLDELLGDARVRKWLIQTVGEHAIHVIREFTCELSDEEISKKTALRASDVRVVLNRLHSQGLANYSRNRDKNSGWYSYMWKLDNPHAKELAEGMKKIEVGKPAEAADVEGAEYYYCSKEGKSKKYLFELARDYNFRCPSCGSMLHYLE